MFDWSGSGHGFVFMDWVLTSFVLLGVILLAAVLRAPDVVESKMKEIAHRIMLGGLMILAARCMYVLTNSGDLIIAPVHIIGLTFVMIAVCVSCIAVLFPHVNDIDEAEARRIINAHNEEINRMSKFVSECENKRKNKCQK
jgi:hypothetical protein